MMIHIEQFTWFDYVLAGVVFLSLILGIKRGFLREIISIITWIAAFFVAILFTNNVAIYVSNFIKSELLANFVAFFALFIATLIIGSIINYIITKLAQKSGLTIGDRFFGAVFGCVRGILIILLIVFVISVTDFQNAKWYQKSQLTYWLQGVSSWIQDNAIKAVKQVQENAATDATSS